MTYSDFKNDLTTNLSSAEVLINPPLKQVYEPYKLSV
jgi:hypothetical protein